MSADVLEFTAQAIADHVTTHDLREVAIVFHGGEPLLAGIRRFRAYLERLTDTIPAVIEFAIQTNATLLSQAYLDLFLKYSVKIGVSLDGGRQQNDLARPFRAGGSSYDSVVKALRLIQSDGNYRRLFGGLLAVIDLRNDPSEVFEALVATGAKSVDVLLPDSHHDLPPPGRQRPDDVSYGKWLVCLFDHWLDSGRDIELRYFEEVISLLLGGTSKLEAIGATSVDIVVIESDGAIEAVDTLKMVGRQVTHTGLNVRSHSLDDALLLPGIYSRTLGYRALCDACNACSELAFCGGGYLPHRWGRGSGFQNPSVYCLDIQYLIDHIRRRIKTLIPGSSSSSIVPRS